MRLLRAGFARQSVPGGNERERRKKEGLGANWRSRNAAAEAGRNWPARVAAPHLTSTRWSCSRRFLHGSCTFQSHSCRKSASAVPGAAVFISDYCASEGKSGWGRGSDSAY